MDLGLFILLVVGVIVCTAALRRPGQEAAGSDDYSGWDTDGDGDGD
jgi:hypothetical protein